ncbi:cytochrome c biogenesis protein [Motilibacter peucedani]|uniref:Cytochrome c biogenesis protein n=1 Tax=Motilibacter peucedani TaxID=598650 RepID=A0A420XL63_9ACTN|nr:cytochrome c biogenesis protein ResB [Motilibacter peucedani]RKS69168.1 cytochrome c biogenesis protein [Motilibacter peucedani]
MVAVVERTASRTPKGLGPVGWARWGWRTLTSMRTALLLLLLLALAAVPGSLLPQQGVNPSRVAAYRDEHPDLAPWVDRLGGFAVYSSPWFAAVYLLLFASLIGCVVPRARLHLRAIRSRPPATPSRLERLQEHRLLSSAAPAADVLTAAREALDAGRYRHDDHPSSVAAEKGYLKETGNLVFHVALLLLLVAFAYGHLLGYTGNRVVTEGEGFGNGQYDSVSYGASAGPGDVVPFTLHLDSLDVRYQQDGDQRGAPRGFDAKVRWTMGARSGTADIAPNEPLVVDGDKVFLTGNGYSLVFTVRDKDGTVVSKERPSVFLPRDGNNTSIGAVKVPEADGGLAFQGVFLPTELMDSKQGPISIFPDLLIPKVFLTAYTGVDASASVYTLDTTHLKQVSDNGVKWTRSIGIGETATLPDGSSITLDTVRRFANFQVSNSTGNLPTLAAAVLALAGLTMSLLMRQRRVWVRATPGADGRTVVEVAGLGKGDSEGLRAEVDALAAELARRLGEQPPDLRPPGPRTDTPQVAHREEST